MMKLVAGILVVAFSLTVIGCNKDETVSGTDDLQKQLGEAAKKNAGKAPPAMKDRMKVPPADQQKTAASGEPKGPAGAQ